MIVVDTSAIVAILLNEPQADALSERLGKAAKRIISAANYIELGAVLAGRGAVKPAKVVQGVDRILAASEIDVAAVTPELAREALRARIRFGKGFGNSAGLNFGDSFAYALARSQKAPLLYVGNDFAATDIRSAL